MIKITSRLQSPASPRASQTPVQAAPPSPEDLALTALLAAQVAAWEVEDTEAVLVVANTWLATHDMADRRYERAVQRKSVIETRRIIQQWMTWTAIRQLWAALAAMERRAAWLAEHAPEIDAGSIEGIWRSLMGERLTPFGVPYPTVSEQAVPAWQRGELEERRATQRAKSKRRRS